MSVMNPNPQDAYLAPSQAAPPPGRRSGECPPRFPLRPSGTRGALSLGSGVRQQPPSCPRSVAPVRVVPVSPTHGHPLSLAGFLDGDADSKGERWPRRTHLCPPLAVTRASGRTAAGGTGVCNVPLVTGGCPGVDVSLSPCCTDPFPTPSPVFLFQVPPIEETFDDNKHSLKPWDTKKVRAGEGP